MNKEELIAKYEECEQLWSQYSCDCLGLELISLHKQIVELGGWE